jgi:superfamily II DNA/RNA helicase
VIATPGRVLDLMEKKIAVMDRCKVLVLDEVCRVDMGLLGLVFICVLIG